MIYLKTNINSLIFKTILFLIVLKLVFSYLTVEHGWWLRDIPTNAERFNIFNVSPNFSNQLDFLITPLLGLFLLKRIRRLKQFNVVLGLIGFMFLLNLFTAFYNGVGILDSVKTTLKIITPILLFYSFLIFYENDKAKAKKVMVFFIKLCVVLTIIGLIFFHNSVNRATEQWPVYFAGIHTHSYVITSIFIGISYLIYQKNNVVLLFIFLITSFLILQIGWGIRTAVIFYLVFILSMLFVKHAFFKYMIFKVLFFLPIIIFLGILISDTDALNKFSSGRLDMYSDKLKLLFNSSIFDFLLGKGYGSDLITTETWWWKEKGSHSDFITFVFENGILYLLSFIGLILSLLKNKKFPNIIILSLLTGYLISSVISNGMAIRPLAAYVFFIVLGYIYLSTYDSKTIFNE